MIPRLSKDTIEILNELEKEIEYCDPVKRNYKYRAFTSKSKGIRNGKRRIRRCWKDVELVSYRDSGFHLWDRFPFDETATETLPSWEPWRAQEHIMDELRK
jgi:hypothetical protein